MSYFSSEVIVILAAVWIVASASIAAASSERGLLNTLATTAILVGCVVVAYYIESGIYSLFN